MQNFEMKKKGFLGVDKIVSDLKSMPKWFKYLMVSAIIVILFFNFFNVQGVAGSSVKSFFEPIARYKSAYNNGSTFGGVANQGASVAVAVLYSLNGLASFTGILAISLIVYNKASQYFWQIISAFFFGLMAISVGYLGDMIMQVIIILGCPIGWYLFEFAGRGEREEEKKSWLYNLIFFLGLAVVIAIVVLVLYEFLPGAFRDTFGKTGAANPYVDDIPGFNKTATRVMDSLTNGFNFVGYVMQVANVNNQFIVWIFVDICKILKYSSICGSQSLSINIVIESCVWLTMASIGLYNRVLKTPIDNLIIKMKHKAVA